MNKLLTFCVDSLLISLFFTFDGGIGFLWIKRLTGVIVVVLGFGQPLAEVLQVFWQLNSLEQLSFTNAWYCF